MATARPVPAQSVALAICAAAAASALWRWHASIGHPGHAEASAEPWDRIKVEYPVPPESSGRSGPSPEAADAVVKANPFSPQRRAVPPPDSGSSSAGPTAAVPPKPQFAYKGRVALGEHQRAVVEETESRKTYFLEVGQEVAGFKVLDIAENRVVLSDPLTHQEVVVSLAKSAGEKQKKP